MLKLNKLFYAADEQDVFSDRIEPTSDQKKFLVDCKNEIRDHLRPQIRQATTTILGMNSAVSPRFRTQGSWSYNTCVQPASLPPQEIDWDFGVYLPVHVWEEKGPPHEMAKAYFVLVEQLLDDLCRKKGWKLISGKETCIRVQVAQWAHIDIPLYAAPEHKFVQVMEKAVLAARSGTVAMDSMWMSESIDFSEMREQDWEDLDDIVMATRSGEWKFSDPEAVSRWFRDKVAEHTEQLRRVCRYLKAWRDYHWRDGGGPTSVSIMIAVAQAFEPHRGRDDLALEKAARHLAGAIPQELREPAIDGGEEDFNSRLSPEEKTIAARKAEAFAQALQQSRILAVHQKIEAIACIQKHLGERVPNRLDLVEADSGAEAIRSVPARQVVPPVVPATSAG